MTRQESPSVTEVYSGVSLLMISAPSSGSSWANLRKRMADIVNVLEKVQMIRIHIQNDADFWEKAKEAVGIFTGFGDKGFRIPHTDISVDCGQNTAHGDRRITVGSPAEYARSWMWWWFCRGCRIQRWALHSFS